MTDKLTTEPPASPCVRKCCLNDDDVCLGCWRTLDEIKIWHSASDYDKHKIITNTEQRRTANKLG